MKKYYKQMFIAIMFLIYMGLFKFIEPISESLKFLEKDYNIIIGYFIYFVFLYMFILFCLKQFNLYKPLFSKAREIYQSILKVSKIDKNLADNRRVYQKDKLLENQISSNPMKLFQQWFLEAQEKELGEANAMTISTIGLDGFPKNRIVLLKQFTGKGFIFYSNYDSEKGKAIEENNKVSLSFFWQTLERQVIIKGYAEKISENLSDSYFESRPNGSKIGAWASNQSEVINSRVTLDEKLHQFEKEFEGKKIPRPQHWGGYFIKPQIIEFWQGRPNRMHDRIQFSLQKDYNWKRERLQP